MAYIDTGLNILAQGLSGIGSTIKGAYDKQFEDEKALRDAKSLEDYRSAQIEQQKARTEVARAEELRLSQAADRENAKYTQQQLANTLKADLLAGAGVVTEAPKYTPEQIKEQRNSYVKEHTTENLDGFTGLLGEIAQEPDPAKKKTLETKLYNKSSKINEMLVSLDKLENERQSNAKTVKKRNARGRIIGESTPVLPKKSRAQKVLERKLKRRVNSLGTTPEGYDPTTVATTDIEALMEQAKSAVKNPTVKTTGPDYKSLLLTAYKQEKDPKKKIALSTLLNEQNNVETTSSAKAIEFNRKRQLAAEKVGMDTKGKMTLAMYKAAVEAEADRRKLTEERRKAFIESKKADYAIFDNAGKDLQFGKEFDRQLLGRK